MQWLQEFFKDDATVYGNEVELRLFGPEHLFLFFLTLSLAILLFLNKEKLKKWRYKETLRPIMAGVFFVNMLVYYLVFILKGVYDWHIHLPLHLCFISGFSFMYVLLTGNRRLFKIVYFFTFVGPLPAMLWPNIPMRFDRFLTYHFFISHHLLLLMGLFCLFVLDYDLRKKDLVKAYLWGNALFVFIFIFNQLFDTDYIMTTGLPHHVLELFPFLEKFNQPILWLEICALLMIAIAYIPVRFLHKEQQGRVHTAPAKTE